jgi:hypothetical protein
MRVMASWSCGVRIDMLDIPVFGLVGTEVYG